MPSALFTRGQICGVNNCRSRLWRVINGQHICQYGHIRENEYEFEDEPDEQSGPKRVITLPKHLTQSQMQSIHEIQSQRSMATMQVFGSAAKRLLFKIAQLVIQKQIEFLVNEVEISQDLYRVVRHVWSLYLDMIFREDIVYDPLHSLILCYLGCKYIHANLYINDILDLASINKLPYIKPAKIIPLKLLSKLPSYYRKHIEPSYLPSNSTFYTEAVSIYRKLKNHKFMKLNVSSILLDQQDFVPKIIANLYLPKQIINGVYNLIDIHKIDLTILSMTDPKRRNTKTSAVITFAEIKLICLIITVTKFYFGLHEGLYTEWQQRFFDNKYSFSNKQTSENDFDKCIKYMSTEGRSRNELDVLMLAFPEDLDDESDFASKYMNKCKPLSKSLEKYLKWFDENVIGYSKNVESMTISDKRLMSIFDGKPDSTSNVENSNIYYHKNYKAKEEYKFTKGKTKDNHNYDHTYDRFTRIKKESLENIMKMERTLISKLSDEFGIQRNQLKYNVTHFSDKLLTQIL